MKIDFHIHTHFSSDGVSSPKEIVRAAIENGIDSICITDHGEIQGAIEALRFGFDKNILVIPGIEILTEAGDILAINVKKLIPNGLSAEKTIQEIHNQEGIAIIPHPFDWPAGPFRGEDGEFFLADAIEVFNATAFKSSNKKALAFTKKYNLAFAAGSDAHKAKFVGRSYLEIPRHNLSEKEILREVKNKSGEIKGNSLSFRETYENCRKGMSIPKLLNHFLRSKSGKSK